MAAVSPSSAPAPERRRYVRAVGPRLRLLLYTVFGLFALLGANSVYLTSITFLNWLARDNNVSYENYFYQLMFLGHLILGLLLIVPVVLFGAFHMKNAWNRPNRRAVAVGYTLFATSLVALLTGLLLMRVEGFEINDPTIRRILYWAHFATPLACVWLYVLHRLSGPKIKWKIGLSWAGAVAVVVIAMIALHRHDPRLWTAKAPKEGEKYFHPSSARTANGNFIPAAALMNNEYCLECHPDVYKSWFHSAHRFSSFNNPFYLFAVKETREVGLKRDGSVQASRWCAGCHDPVPFFSGAFDDPNFDMKNHPTSQAGISCTACHSITSLEGGHRGLIGNGNYTIEEPVHYPFAFEPTNSLAYYLNLQLVKAKPDFHKKTFLKPLHKSAEFCSTCHKVGLPYELNHYKEFLRGQNHYDTYLLSGVSGVNARAFYYPEKAKLNCNECHMPLQKSDDFAAKLYGTNDFRAVHDHLFPAANTALPHIRNEPDLVKIHQDYLKDCIRVDVFGLKEGGTIDSPLFAPIRPKVPALKPGRTYLIETVVRTVRLGHPLTQGTVDSNELWADVRVTDPDGTVLGRSGGLGQFKEVDPWAHFLNVYMLDKDGNRIDRRNPQDIFVPLYNNQIPPGAAHVLHYKLTVPPDQKEPLTVEVKVNYRKFDTIFYNYVMAPGYTNGLPFQLTNDLPITVLASDRVTFPIVGGDTSNLAAIESQTSPIPLWQRWNDYGIGLFLKGDKGSEKGELVQAAAAFAEVEKLGRADGPLNLARVYFKEGRLDEAVQTLQRANDTNRFNPPGNRWTIAWLNGLVNKQNGHLDDAIREFTSILEDRYPELEARGFNFSRDYEVINELGQTLFERAKMERANPTRREELLRQAARRFEDTLAIDIENVTAHYNLGLIYASLGDTAQAEEHRRLHERYRPDDNARDRAVANARRRDRAADHASQAIVIYDLQRESGERFSDARK
ncbi:MAG: tetratricopeptide repeat protein [Verrucomicrobia bacterium]|nr:tetratricopeptide repeat protein [Verrucomicrobiota bacterium]